MKKIICKRLRLLREEKGETQIQVSKNTGINNKTLSGYENGVSDPDLETLRILANYYQVTIDYLLGQTDDPRPYIGNSGDILAAHRVGGIDELPEEAKKQLDDYIDFLRNKYKK